MRVESGESSIFVHEGKGKICNSVSVYINGIDIADDGSCDVSWRHEVWYYNDVPGAEPRVYKKDEDGAHAKLYAWVKMFEWDEEGNKGDSWAYFAEAEKGAEGDEFLYLGLDVKYSAYANATFKETIGDYVDRDGDGEKEHFEPNRLTENREYRFLANTDLVNANDKVDNQTIILWTDIKRGKLMHRSDRRKYIGKFEDADESVVSGPPVWINGSNSVGGSVGTFKEW